MSGAYLSMHEESALRLHRLIEAIKANGFEADALDLEQELRETLAPYGTSWLAGMELAEVAHALMPVALANEVREVSRSLDGEWP